MTRFDERLGDAGPGAGPLTLLVVHAHPDDEAGQTGGTLARYVAEGHRVVLVTCTDGRMGDTVDGLKPGAPGHDPLEVARVRATELARSGAALGLSDVRSLGHPDSGMPADPADVEPTAFSRLPTGPLAAELVDLMTALRPDVVVTYPANGLSGHPDHVRTHDVTVRAFAEYADAARPAAAPGTGPDLYFIAISRSGLERTHDRARRAGHEGWLPPLEIGVRDEEITAAIDVREHREQKRAALTAHASQADARGLLQLMSLAAGFGDVEYYVRVTRP